MSQISPPIRIVLAAAAIFLVAWMTVLRPKTDAVPPAATPAGNLAKGTAAVSAPGKIVANARDAANAASAKEQARASGDPGADTAGAPSATTATGAASGTAPATATASVDTKGVPAPVARAIAKDKVLVLLFWNHDAAVDRDVKRALAKVDRWDGSVFVKAVPLAQVGRYNRITNGAGVGQSPSVVVVDRNLQATTIPGYTDTKSIDQAVVDALRASGALFTSAFLRDVNRVCAHYDQGLLGISTPSGVTQGPDSLHSHVATLGSFRAELRGLKAPARYAGFKRAFVADTGALRGVLLDWSAALGAHPSAARSISVSRRFGKQGAPIAHRMNARSAKHHLISCLG